MKTVFIAFVSLFISVFSAAQSKYEMRAAWIATVANIDWPSKGVTDPDEQMKEMTVMLDSLAAMHFNAIAFQVRPTADAFYSSDIEPWSNFLTGRTGVAPEPFYDPLAYVINQAHKRFMEVHAWINPYRLLNENRLNLLPANSIYYQHPEMFLKYGDKYYFNPGLDETRNYLNRIVKDLVSRYDIDAVHLDDYFYPYKISGVRFPDYATFKKYPRGFKNIDNWRRNNVTMVIQELHDSIKKTKPWVELGVSPFGVWRNASTDPEGSKTRAGQTNYDDLYADVLLWLKKNYIDYVVPQLYWRISSKTVGYNVLADWWNEHSYGKNLYIGLYASQLGNRQAGTSWVEGNEIVRQLNINKRYKNIEGVFYFSTVALMQNRLGLSDSLICHYYKYPALVPVNKNMEGKASLQPDSLKIVQRGDRKYLIWNDRAGSGGLQTAYYIVYGFCGRKVGDINNPQNILIRSTDNLVDLTNVISPAKNETVTFVVTSVNRYKYESLAKNSITYTF